MSLMKRPSAEPVNRAARCYLRFAGARRPQLDFFTISDCAASAVCGASRLLALRRGLWCIKNLALRGQPVVLGRSMRAAAPHPDFIGPFANTIGQCL